ncbi:MMPL family transporter [Sorangium atrum]|uniref:MMPL family transporter n=1 Tax=Sorangium atrum TaxID=2995308 RepID=A0ABT5CFY5_9BACT|nr:MMPL family transporter [Sorangium aterium]MDC0684563.1 MMPL family transporter [Sorangium aterium]
MAAPPSPPSARADARRRPLRLVVVVALAALTLAAFAAVTLRLQLEPNVASLLPERGDAAALRRYVRGFGGGDLGVVMVKGDDPDENAAVAAEIARALAARPTVQRAADRIDVSRSLDPWVAFRHADARVRERLAAALSPEGMRERLAETRAMLLAPGGGAAAETIAADPLRLSQLVFESADIGSGVRTQADGAFASDDGKVHLVLVQPAGQALRGADARAFVADANAVLGPVRAAHPGLTLGLTGGHAIAAATEAMLTRDLAISGSLSMLLASVVFALLFRRLRALAAVMPPLVLGTLWTAGLATALPGGLSAIAVAFMSVVVGVGVDTGVHVYAALLEARREGLDPEAAGRAARARTSRAVLIAAVTAGAAFGALALSDINALRQLGLLCAAGEVLTAIAIVLVTPAVGAWLERGTPPIEAPARWPDFLYRLTRTRGRALALAGLAALPIAAVALGASPPLAEAIVAIRPAELEPLKVQQEIFEAFGGRRGQWVVLVADGDQERARARGDRIAERLASMKDDVEAVDALTALAPAAPTQAERFAARDALDLPGKADELERALRDTGFAPERFSSVLDGMRAPPRQEVALSDLERGPASILLSRYLGADGGEALVALYVRPRETGSVERIERALREEDPRAMLTGYSRLEASLRETLAHDMPRIALVAGALVLLALSASLRSARDIALAAIVVASEISLVLLLIRVLGIPLHAYDALVIPVLLGITVDEGMFLLHRAREIEAAGGGDAVIREMLRREGPAIAATALTTAAGFSALAFCGFDGLRDLGRVGALGSAVGLVVALLVVPAGLRLWPRAHGRA